MRNRLLRVFIIGLALVMLAAAAGAQVPTRIGYQGVLLDSEGNPVTEPVNVIFTIYDQPSGGGMIWQEIQLVEFDAEGRFDVSLGEVMPLLPDVFDGPERWLGIQVMGDDELEPRIRIVSVPYSIWASTVPGAGGGGGWVDDGAVVRLETSTDNVGIGTSTPLAKLHVDTDGNYGVAGSVSAAGSDEYIGAVGLVEGGTGTNTGVLGNSSDGNINRGVSGQAEGTGNDNIGVHGSATDGTINRGLVGEAHGPSDENIGVYGYAEGGDANWAGYFNGDVGVAQNIEIDGKAAIGLGNTNTGTSAFAVGEYNSADGYASFVAGQNSSAAGYLSFAAGRRATAGHNGTFVWADQTDAGFASTAEDQFLIRASGGVGIGTPSPDYKLDVEGTVGIDVGSNYNDVPFTIDVPANQAGLISRIAKGGSIINVVDNNGNVGIGTFSPQGALDVNSTTGAFIVPRMTTTQRDALTAVNGMIIYNTTTDQFNFYEAGAWVTK